jgi:hypothetical protein
VGVILGEFGIGGSCSVSKREVGKVFMVFPMVSYLNLNSIATTSCCVIWVNSSSPYDGAYFNSVL